MSSEKGVVLVTGGTRGLGAAIAQAFQQVQYSVVSTYHRGKEQAKKFHQETQIPVQAWDITDPEACQQGVEAIEEVYGPIRVLINNAGIFSDGLIQDMTLAQWKQVLDVNLNGVFYMVKAVMKPMCQRKYGRIITIGSVNGSRSDKGIANYSASKAAILGLTRSIAQEGAPHGITANVVAPGYLRTGLTDNIDPSVLAKIIKGIPLRRLGTPEEVAALVVFVASSPFLTGATLPINGGQWMD